MLNEPSLVQFRNCGNAVPGHTERPLPLGRIFARQEKPRLPKDHVRSLLKTLVDKGLVESIEAGGHTYYRKRPAVALPAEAPYNYAQGSTSLDADVDMLLLALAPLRQGKTIFMWMDDPLIKARKHYTGPTRRLMVLAPSRHTGRNVVICSIVDKGCFILMTGNPTLEIGRAVLAGIPAALATALVKTIYRVFKEI